MATFDDKERAVSRVYAEALLSLARKQGVADEVREELDALAALCDADAGFRDFLSNPAIDVEERRRSQETMFRGRLLDVTVDALQVLNAKGRSALLPAVVGAYRAAHDKASRRVGVKVTSARPLTDGQRGSLAEAVRRTTGFEASFEETVDPSIVGGLVVQIGDQKTDGSVATRLHNLSEALLARASREIHSGTYVEGTNG
jgi:F-type H+-transporting ATPase subunit delta